MGEPERVQIVENVSPERRPQDGIAADRGAAVSPVPDAERYVIPNLPQHYRPRAHRVDLDTLFWALILIWVGGVLLAANFGLLDWFTLAAADLASGLPFGNAVWTLIFLGVAMLVTIEIVVRLLVPAYRRNVLGYVILVIVFASLGLGLTEIMWPMILVAVGAALLLRARGRQ